jgi:signal transduction histidine kinase
VYPAIEVVQTPIGAALMQERRVSVTRVFAGGCALAALVVLAGAAFEIFRLGSSDAVAADRVERDVRAAFVEMTADVEGVARAVAGDRRVSDAMAADAGTGDADRILFDAAADGRQRLPEDLAVVAVTIYDGNGSPRGWSGRASDLPADRTKGAASLFVTPSPLGLRLFSLQPIAAPSSDRAGLGSVAAEHVLTAAPASSILLTASEYVMPTARGPVSLKLHDGRAPPAPNTFVIQAPDGRPLLDAAIAPAELAATRERLRRFVVALAIAVFALTVLLLAGPLLDARAGASTAPRDWRLTLTIIVVTLAGAALLAVAFQISPWSSVRANRTAFRLLLAGITAAAVAATIVSAAVRLRVGLRSRRRWPTGDAAAFVAGQLACGVILAAVLVIFEGVLGRSLDPAAEDLRHFSLHPWTAPRLATLAGVLLGHAAVLWTGTLACVLALARWRLPRRWSSRHLTAAALWLVPIGAVALAGVAMNWPVPVSAVVLGALACAAAALVAPRLATWYRRATVASRILALFMAFLIPALLVYPSVHFFAERTMRYLVEKRYAVEAMTHPQVLQDRLQQALREIDALPGLPDLVLAAAKTPAVSPRTDAAFRIWSQTVLARERLTSDLEIYDEKGAPVGRPFALNFPESSAAQPPERLRSCEWEVFGEALLFGGAQERNTLHAQRSVCVDGRPVATLLVHVVFDYRTLPFIRSQSASFDAFSAGGVTNPLEAPPAGEVEFTAYGWGLTAIYTSGPDAWPLDDATFARVYRSREPFWTVLLKDNTTYNVYFTNDRQFIYALGYAIPGVFDHLVRLAELTTLAAVGYVLVLIGNALFTKLSRARPRTGRSLLREIRASFYRKLFLAFVLASIFPVVILVVVIRTYFASLLISDIKGEATRTAAVAQRVIEESGALLRAGAEGVSTPLRDEVMVWISQLINQDVNVYGQAELVATSERDLFAFGLLPTRTPDELYRAIVLQRLPSFVGEDRIGSIPFMLAAAPLRSAGPNAMVTVPLAFRQHEVEREIDELDRGVHLAALFFILLGAAIGLSMAERIADPIRQLTRATGRIARGDFDARIAVRSSDELRRLVDAFNGMADELKAQRDQLERTHRLEAWAEMARQVAHEIKNPLTPIQLSAEHLLRVHADRGAPLGPVLEGCVTSILGQVRLLRQIAGEFSSFASSPTARRAPADPVQLVHDVVEPYRVGLEGRIEVRNEVTAPLPPVVVDRTLVARALANIVENALHAMPATGSLRVTASVEEDTVAIRIEDTGFGMDEEALGRVFEPYFSTKTTGTGLGLPIARRNIELSGGSITVESSKGQGTAVTMRLPLNP